MRIKLLTESSAKTWFVKCWICWTPWSTFISSRAIPPRSKGNLMMKQLAHSQFVENSLDCFSLNLVQFTGFKHGQWKQVHHGGDIGTLMENKGIHFRQDGRRQMCCILVSLVEQECTLLPVVAFRCWMNAESLFGHKQSFPWYHSVNQSTTWGESYHTWCINHCCQLWLSFDPLPTQDTKNICRVQ